MNTNQMKRIASKTQHPKYSHCTIIYAGSRLMAYGHNTKSNHAEINALRALSRLLRKNPNMSKKNLHMVNFMIKKNGRLGDSYPCDACYMKATLAGVRTITAFDSDGNPRQIGGLV